MVDPSQLQEIDLRRDPNTGEFVAVDPSDGTVFPLPVQDLDVSGTVSTDQIDDDGSGDVSFLNPVVGESFEVTSENTRNPSLAVVDSASDNTGPITLDCSADDSDMYALWVSGQTGSAGGSIELRVNNQSSGYGYIQQDGTTNTAQSAYEILNTGRFSPYSAKITITDRQQFGFVRTPISSEVGARAGTLNSLSVAGDVNLNNPPVDSIDIIVPSFGAQLVATLLSISG